MTIRVFIVDDQELVRAGCEMVIAAQPDMEVVGSAGDGAAALERLAVTRADVVLMDIRMPRVDGVEATRRLRARGDLPRVLVLTTFDLDEYVVAALAAGASGFLVKDAPADELLRAVRSVAAGDAALSPSSTRRLIDHVAGDLLPPASGGLPIDRGQGQIARLTDRERDVFWALVRGRSNAEIAAELHLAQGTVKLHVGRILTKLDLADRVQVVIFAYENRLVRAGRPMPGEADQQT
ncbi:response regulator transcription factor [Nocardioides albus]|uniref:DNA-binding NarL/FixJ family response regulator n=1 Tax=Nocardioides albus TaxID=1841 RepID=A0A7W5A7L8_9ACTN|nr:response regulator transcription factor [Nocardioides albus]MBB3091057.1 DNA-binding NarL/FixJ family response regulator [Nocardioides albus]GGU34640.1 DNA-binding response regulator [Nocardioides albus]